MNGWTDGGGMARLEEEVTGGVMDVESEGTGRILVVVAFVVYRRQTGWRGGRSEGRWREAGLRREGEAVVEGR